MPDGARSKDASIVPGLNAAFVRIGWISPMEKRPRQRSETQPKWEAWERDRSRMVRTRMAYLRSYSEQFHRMFGRAPSESDLERAVEQFEPDTSF